MRKTPAAPLAAVRSPRRSRRPTVMLSPWSATKKGAVFALVGVALCGLGFLVREVRAQQAEARRETARAERLVRALDVLARESAASAPDVERMLAEAAAVRDLARGSRWEADLARHERFARDTAARRIDQSTRHALLAALEDPAFSSAHAADALRSLRMLQDHPHATDDASFRERLDRAAAVAAAHAPVEIAVRE